MEGSYSLRNHGRLKGHPPTVGGFPTPIPYNYCFYIPPQTFKKLISSIFQQAISTKYPMGQTRIENLAPPSNFWSPTTGFPNSAILGGLMTKSHYKLRQYGYYVLWLCIKAKDRHRKYLLEPSKAVDFLKKLRKREEFENKT